LIGIVSGVAIVVLGLGAAVSALAST